MEPKKFQTIIDDLNKEIEQYQEHREKLYDLIQRIFYIDKTLAPPIVPGEQATVEMQLKGSIGRMKDINEQFAECLQIMSGWV